MTIEIMINIMMRIFFTSFRSFFSFFFLGGGSSGGGGRCDFFSLLGLKISCFLSMKYLEYCSEYHFDLINVLSISELTSSKKVKRFREWKLLCQYFSNRTFSELLLQMQSQNAREHCKFFSHFHLRLYKHWLICLLNIFEPACSVSRADGRNVIPLNLYHWHWKHS